MSFGGSAPDAPATAATPQCGSLAPLVRPARPLWRTGQLPAHPAPSGFGRAGAGLRPPLRSAPLPVLASAPRPAPFVGAPPQCVLRSGRAPAAFALLRSAGYGSAPSGLDRGRAPALRYGPTQIPHAILPAGGGPIGPQGPAPRPPPPSPPPPCHAPQCLAGRGSAGVFPATAGRISGPAGIRPRDAAPRHLGRSAGRTSFPEGFPDGFLVLHPGPRR